MALIVSAESEILLQPVYRFGDEKEIIVFGRDAERCDVIFPASQRRAGREHFALKKGLGQVSSAAQQ